MTSFPRIHGANLGNWLVLEKWMSPNLFDGTNAEDEYYLAHDLDPDVYTARVQVHRDTYITERDFVELAGWGINSVRIPVPYFIFGDYPPFIGGIDYLDRAFSWAEKWGISILVDLHTVPGSQNGFDNGGISGVCTWSTTPSAVTQTYDILRRLAQRYGSHPALYGIEVLNEPNTATSWKTMNIEDRYPARDKEMARNNAPVSFDFLEEFYETSYEVLRSCMDNDKYIVFHDGFDAYRWGNYFDQFSHIIVDTHQYLMMAELDGCEQSVAGYQRYIEQKYVPLIHHLAAYTPVIVGEWSLFNSYACGVDTHGGRSVLNGDEGSHAEAFTPALKRQIYRALAASQLSAWGKCWGHYYWNGKLGTDTVNAPGWIGWDAWDLGRAVSQGWFPVDEGSK